MKKTLFFSKGDGKAAFIHALYAAGKLPGYRQSLPHEVKQALDKVGFHHHAEGKWVMINQNDENIIYACGVGKSEFILHKAWLCFMQLERDCPIEWNLIKIDP
jgi:hypothetical protein